MAVTTLKKKDQNLLFSSTSERDSRDLIRAADPMVESNKPGIRPVICRVQSYWESQEISV